MDTLILITVDAQKREIAHRFEKNRNGTQVLAECPVILKQEGEHNTDKGNKSAFPARKSQNMICSRCATCIRNSPDTNARDRRKHHIAKEAQLFFSWLLRLIVGQKVQHHSCPAGVTAPATPKKATVRKIFATA